MDTEASWRAWLATHTGPLPLDEALQRIAVDEGASLTLADLQGRLDALAEGIVPAAVGSEPIARLRNLVHHLFDEHGFRGDTESYDDPANSRIDRVLERKKGLPILLAALTLEVGRRAGVAMVGVAYPAHFLVSTLEEPRMFLDAFHGGRLLRAADLEVELRGRFGAVDPVRISEALAPTTTVDLLVRVSTNLIVAWSKRGDLVAALRNADRRVALRPDLPELRRDRGQLRSQAGDRTGAMVDLSTYLDEAPAAPDAERVRWSLMLLAQPPR